MFPGDSRHIQISTQTCLWTDRTAFFATTTKTYMISWQVPFSNTGHTGVFKTSRKKKYIVHRKKNSGSGSILFSFNGPKEEGVTCWPSTLGLSWHSSREVNHFDINSKNSWKLIFVLVKKSLFTWTPGHTNTVTVIEQTVEATWPFSQRPQEHSNTKQS